MASGNITGGSVSLLERIKTGEWEHKEAKVELHFNVYDGQDHRDLLDQAHDAVVAKVSQVLGRTHRETVQARKEARRPPRIEVEVAAENATTEDAVQVAAAKGELPVNKVVVTTDDPYAKADAARLAKVTADPLDVSGDPAQSVTAQPSAPSADASTENADPLDMGLDLTAAAPEVTDADLNVQVQFHNNRLIEHFRKRGGTDDGSEGTLQLRGVIGKYVPVGKKVKDISQDQRQNFLDDLKALPKR